MFTNPEYSTPIPFWLLERIYYQAKLLKEYPEILPQHPKWDKGLSDLATDIWHKKYKMAPGLFEYQAVREAEKELLLNEAGKILKDNA